MLALAFAGGGVSGAAHAGVIRALVEAGIRIDCVCGTSSGAIVAAVYASGRDPSDPTLWSRLATRRLLDYDVRGLLRKLWRPRRGVGGLVRGEKLQRTLQEMVGEQRLCDIPFPLGICATDLVSSQEVVFSSRPLAATDLPLHVINDAPVDQAVRASFGIPGYFQPLRMNGRVLVDGGVIDNCPILVARAMGATHVIAVDTITPFTTMPTNLQTTVGILTRVVNIALASQVRVQSHAADFVLHPQVGYVGALEWGAIGRCMEAGYRIAKDHQDQLIAIAKAAGSWVK